MSTPGMSSTPTPKGPLFIYFIRAEGTGFVKIGKTLNPWQRQLELQTSNPHKLTLLCAVLDQTGTGEAELHKRFQSLRERGEWFREQDALADLLEERFSILRVRERTGSAEIF